MIATIGHSTRPVPEFITLLKAHHIQVLVDVRTIPRSRHNPQFSQTALRDALQKENITYLHIPELGGLRRPFKDSLNTAWRNLSFRGYADHMQTEEFAHGIQQVLEIAREKNIALMCAEGNPFRCHRRLIADALIARGFSVWEISSAQSKRMHHLTSFASTDGTRVTYP